MLFRQLFDAESSTYTYLLADLATREAVLIDPVLEQVERDVRLVQELGLKLQVVLETHVHADHITAAGLLRERTGARVFASARGAPCVDRQLSQGDVVRVGGIEVRVLETPGHTDDSLSFLCDGRLFSGDALLVRGTGRTDFQNGDPGQLYDSITRELFSLPDATEVYPAHDYAGFTMTSVGEEKRHNPRLAGKSREDFVAFMKARQIPPPRKLDVAVPANRACGLSEPSSPHPA
ncbi:metallo-beta-lactamase family protein [Myxococcus stipitatus DSM 14675]|uniref:Metallo-beta-lactamase family protein n=1 Tax=Myxococcus stipitatus (strain DSM 14675 / JCM 12634 / Mx s8) TaxID=1278073 RepID=L7U1R7_MYXSD|nr:MBL fold metallo-hydrolase [Myxococcus stipitatus]AGC41532.1 metallo-beta-lactamase family protein [Myxococcus stipitatus DSM 14675]